MFKSIKNSLLDTPEQILARTKVFGWYVEKAIADAPNRLELVQSYYRGAEQRAEFVDEILSKILSGIDLLEYAGRMKFILLNIGNLGRELKAAEARPNRQLNISSCGAFMAYLEGQLKGLCFTVEELNLAQAA